MGRELLENEPVFRQTIERCDALLRQHADWSLLAELTADEASSRLQETAIAQPALFALQVALAALWKSWGVEPEAVVGHSVGEVAAAHIAGALRLEDAAGDLSPRAVHGSRLVEGQDAGRGTLHAGGGTSHSGV